jgi:pyruvate kinase
MQVPREAPRSVGSLRDRLELLRERLLAFEAHFAPRVAEVSPAYSASARNLLHYVALRQEDVRAEQVELAEAGLSSLGRLEDHVLASLEAILGQLRPAGSRGDVADRQPRPAVGFAEGRRLIQAHTEALLGGRPRSRNVRVMVTLPTEAAADPALVHGLIRAGMDVARINCAHDGPAEWEQMAANVRAAVRALRRPCRILMDLGGPKLRTGALTPGPRVLRWRPRRNDAGDVIAPARVLLVDAEAPPRLVEGAVVLPLASARLRRLRPGDRLELTDRRGRSRTLTVTGKLAGAVLAESDRTAYVSPGIELHRSGAARRRPGDGRLGVVGDLPPLAQALTLSEGDLLLLTADEAPGVPALPAQGDQPATPARISCTLPEVLSDLRVGERIYFDDGKIGGLVESLEPGVASIRIVHAKPGGSRLRADKGINLPDTRLRVAGLTPKDREDLDTVVKVADLVALSFVRTPEDVRDLQEQLAQRRARSLGVVLKVETRQALDRLHEILLTAMRSHPVGVMIARGDLAVELGYERLAEAQEEILCLCEASHVPVIWATQVLENLTQQGQPSRAEVTDAAASVRAECVMLNKGPYILEAIHLLDDILRRMEAHQDKRTTLMGRLHPLPGPDAPDERNP